MNKKPNHSDLCTPKALFCALLVFGTLVAESSAPLLASPQTKDLPDLFATIQLTSQSYCALDKPAGLAIFELHIRIENRSQTRAILSKKYLRMGTPELDRIGPDGRSDGVLSRMIGDSYGYDRQVPKNFNRDYIVIEPGQAHEMESKADISIRTDRPQYNWGGGLVRPGDYLLGVVLSTWDASPEASAELRSRWIKKGHLYDGVIDSNLIPVKIDPPTTLAFCPGRDEAH
ncbi:MAG: hypothetical protein WBQ43_16645 [Terriglobales bacterium]